MRKRTLALRREALSELSAGELGGVVGGTHAACGQTDGCTHDSLQEVCVVPTTPPVQCLSLDRRCPPLTR